MGDMVRRVAMAINPDAFDVDYQKRYLFKAWQDQAKLIAYREARAAIEAMREPSVDMRNAGFSSDAFRTPMARLEADFEPRVVYQSMIEAALK